MQSINKPAKGIENAPTDPFASTLIPVLLDHWHELRGALALPDWSSFDPGAVKAALPNLMVIGFNQNIPVVRLCGGAVERLTGKITGFPLSKVRFPGLNRLKIDGPGWPTTRPRLWRAEFAVANDLLPVVEHWIEVLILPFAGPDRIPERLLVAIEYDELSEQELAHLRSGPLQTGSFS